MARCGCGTVDCACSVQGAGLVTVTGSGSPANPFIATVTCANVRTCFTAGANITIVDGVISSTGGGGGAATALTVLDTNCINMTVTGTGTALDPFVVSAAPVVAPEPNGLECGPTGLTVPPSSDAGNTLIIGTDGRLFTPPGAGGGVPFTVTDTNTVNLTVTPADPQNLTANVIVDPDADNILVANPNGLFVPPTEVTVQDTPTLDLTITGTGAPGDPFTISGVAAGATPTALQALDTNCINTTVTGTGTPGDPFIVSASPVIAPEPNGLECGPTGLTVPPSSDVGNVLAIGTDGRLFAPPPGAAAATVITALDTNCIDTTVTGAGTLANPFIVSAAPIIAPEPNALECGATGLLVTPTAVQALDTNCINTTVTGTGTTADPFIVSAAPTLAPEPNALECGATGLLVAPTAVQALDTTCVNTTVTGTGTTVDPFIVSSVPIIAPEPNGLECGPTGLTVPPSSDAGNALVMGTDGRLFTPTVAGAATVIQALDTNCINTTVTGTGTLADPFIVSAAPIVAPEPNGLECGPTGLTVPPSSDVGNVLAIGTDGRLFAPPPGAAAATVIQALDTNCINTTVTGAGTLANPFIISAAPTLDPSVQNALTCGPAGLLADVAAQALDTSCINTTVTGSGTTGDPFVISSVPIIAPEPNGLTCGPTGLVVAPSTDVGNIITIGTDGNLLATGGGGEATTVADTPTVNLTLTGTQITADVIPACGLESTALGLAANVAAWPFACPQDANAQDVYCSPGTGQLQTAPEKFAASQYVPVGATVINTQPAACPGPTVVFNDVGAMVFVNPDPCRPMVMHMELGGRVRLDVTNSLILTNVNAFTINATTQYQVNGGGFILARNDTYNHESTAANQTTAAGHVFESTPAPIIIPAGGAVTIDTRQEYTCSGDVDGTQIQITRNGPSIRAVGWSQ